MMCTLDFTNIINSDNFAFFHFYIGLFYSCCQSLWLQKEAQLLLAFKTLPSVGQNFISCFSRICKYWMLCSLQVFHVLYHNMQLSIKSVLCGTKKLCRYTYPHHKTVSLYLNNGKSTQEFRVHRSNGFKWLSVRSLSASYSHFSNESAALKRKVAND